MSAQRTAPGAGVGRRPEPGAGKTDLDAFATLLNALRDDAGARARRGGVGKAAVAAEIEAEARVLPRLTLEMAARLDRAALVRAFAATAGHCLAPLPPDDLRRFLDQADMLLEPERGAERHAEGAGVGRRPEPEAER